MLRQTWFFSLDSVKSGLRILASDGVITQTGQSSGSAPAGGPRARAAAGGPAGPVRQVGARRAGQAAGRRHLCVSRSGTADAGDLLRDSAARSSPDLALWLPKGI